MDFCLRNERLLAILIPTLVKWIDEGSGLAHLPEIRPHLPPALRLSTAPPVRATVASDTAKQSLSLGQIEEEVKYLLEQKFQGSVAWLVLT